MLVKALQALRHTQPTGIPMSTHLQACHHIVGALQLLLQCCSVALKARDAAHKGVNTSLHAEQTGLGWCVIRWEAGGACR